MSRKPQKKEFEDAKPHRCPVCENYIRKIEEVEQTLSGKETIITALQKQLKKCEDNYKDMFNNFEKMRFEHSTALQDNFSLKEINSKLQEVTLEKKKCSKCKECPKKNLDQILKSDNQRELPNHLIQPLLNEIGHIEKLVDSQNRILKELIEKIVNEIKDTKTSCIGLQGVPKIGNDFKQIESGDHLNLETHPKFQKLVAEIEGLKSLIENNRRENDRMKSFLLDKADKLTQCNKISEKTDQETCATDMADSHHNSIIAKLKNEIKEKEGHFEKCTCQLIEQLNDMHSNNQVLSDTLEVVTAENKNNLGIINKLKEELSRANQECEKKIEALKSRINQLENDLEENKDSDKKLKDCINRSETETRNLKDRLKQLIEENNKLRDCRCDAETEMKLKMAEMEADNEALKKELMEKTLELTEYEEENRNFCQKLEVLTNYNGELMNKINKLQQELTEKSKEVDTSERKIQTSSALVSKDKLDEVNKENKCLSEKCRVDQIEIADKTFQLECLKKSIKTQLEELDKLSVENDELRKEIDRIKQENKVEVEKWQAMVNHSQNQVEMLLKEHDEKTSQIQSVANELDNIRRSVTEDNDTFMNRIKQLETENEELTKIAKEHEKCKTCTCDGAREEIERLKVELIKKQCIILELEKSVDNFNETMKSFDKTAEALTCENSCLKLERDQLVKDMEELQSKLTEKIDELDKVRKQLENAEVICGKCAKAAKTLEVENMQLKNQCQACLSKKEQLELENDALKKELDKLREAKGQLEKTIAENYQLQMELDTLKSEYTRHNSTMSGKLNNLQQAYDEMKKLFDLTNAENEKLRENIKKCTQSIEESRKNCSCLEEQNQELKKETRMVSEEVDCLRTECDKLKKHCAKKCLEVQALKETVDDQRVENRAYEKNCQSLKQKQAACEKELAELKDKLNELKKDYDQKTQELKKIRKQYESCAKQSQITREEYNNLRKEYKEIKAMLSEQIKRYRLDTDSMEASQPCQVVIDLKRQLKEKENQMMALQQKLTESSYEIIELKDYINKLICDNNILKSAINSLICNLENKIKGPSFGSLPSNSAEAIAGEILNSLSSIENIVKSNAETCPRGCPAKKCDCMTEITFQYSKGNIARDRPSKQQFAQTNSRSPSKSKSEQMGKPSSAPLPKVSSEPRKDDSETTDSEDPQSTSFLDKK